jgi:YbgC/YbaW family acyl-CoA thioester hydrolase
MQHVYNRHVHFADTDAAGVVHFSRLLCYAEEAEHELLDKLEIPLFGDGGWPRVHVECNYHAPIRMGDSVHVVLQIKKLGRSSIFWQFSIQLGELQIATGEMKTVRVDDAGKPVELLEEWRNRLLR